MPRSFTLSSMLLCAALAACATQDGPAPRDLSGGSDLGMDAAPHDDGVLGVWRVSGSDTRGAYTGQLELRGTGDGEVEALRVIEYTDATVEDGRALWWVWTGGAYPTSTGYAVSVSLRRADFVRSRGGVTRSDADKAPLPISGTLAFSSSMGSAHWSGAGVSADDSLSARVDAGAQPIFASLRASTPASDTPSALQKQGLFTLYATYQALPDVAPYAQDTAFQAGVLDVIADPTDFDFYRAHPMALRVVDKVIDAPSLGETLARASAYGQTLAAKAAVFDAQTPAEFIDATSGQLVDSRVAGVQIPTGDGALWTATYVASQAYRYLVTGSADALANVEKSIDGIQTLLEITPDQTTFARTIRPASGAATGLWHAGTGAFAAYDWLEGGNNDMYKGLVYGTLTAYLVLCDPVVTGKDALCARLRTNAAHLQDLSVVGGTTDNNHLMAVWLSAWLNGSVSDLGKAVTSWAVLSSAVEQANFQERAFATADWSGTHLGLVQMLVLSVLADKAPLPGFDAKASIRTGIEKMRGDFQLFRMGLWSVLFAKLTGSPQTIDAENARWRLREIPAPRLSLDVDHRVGAGFVMSPYPELPWKNDWTTHDRSASLHGYPLFEQGLDVYCWRSSPFSYARDGEGIESPGVDYLHAYWLGRHLGLFDATE